jgi:hypothetical protein
MAMPALRSGCAPPITRRCASDRMVSICTAASTLNGVLPLEMSFRRLRTSAGNAWPSMPSSSA